MYFNYHDMFNTKHPGFFEKESIRTLPPENIYEEQLMDLHTYDPDAVEVPCPANITFGVYEGDFEDLQRTVLEIDDSWDGIFQPDTPVYAAYDGDKLVGLCILEDFGAYEGYKIGGPGCIGVLDEYRRQGIAAALTSRLALEILAIGKVPFYCAAWCNLKSVRNAIKCGFRPAWVELTARESAFVDKMNER